MEDDDGDYTVDCSEEEFWELTERLLDNDDNNCAKYFRYNLQERRKGCEDVCDEPLFQVGGEGEGEGEGWKEIFL